ncbi:MAG: TlpA family protein disulfide reductase [Muribaculaceae bacterium]|nr:TlpA family protein disulfide reductase [Muribaculaceae bacterium]
MKKFIYSLTAAALLTACNNGNNGVTDSLSPSFECDSATVNLTVVGADSSQEIYVAAIANTYDEIGEIQPTKLDENGQATFKFDLQGDIMLSFDSGIRGRFRVAPGEVTNVTVYPDSIVTTGRFAKYNRAMNSYESRHGINMFMPDFMRYDMNGDQFTEALLKKYADEKAAIAADTELTEEQRMVENANLLASVISMAGDRYMLDRCSYVMTHPDCKGAIPKDSLNVEMSDDNYRAVVAAIDLNDESMMMSPFEPIPSIAGVDWNKYGAEGTLLGNLSTYVRAAKAAAVDNVDPEVLAKLEALQNPFFANGVKSIRAAARARNEEAAKLVSAVPEVEYAEIIPAIAAKHPGKVVIFDVWNTWCGPCKAAIAANEPLKKTEYNDPDIVFVYLVDDSSPVTNYYQMIPNIAGEHYRLSADQAKEAYGRYNLDGFPFYLIVDRQGNIEARPDFRDHEIYSKTVKEKLAQK